MLYTTHEMYFAFSPLSLIDMPTNDIEIVIIICLTIRFEDIKSSTENKMLISHLAILSLCESRNE